jgi:hypothetical protein
VTASLIAGWLAPGLSWLWWNPLGLAACVAVGVGFGRRRESLVPERLAVQGTMHAMLLVALFIVIVALLGCWEVLIARAAASPGGGE